MRILNALVALLICTTTFASHIVGGDFKVVQTGPNTFEVTLTIFRDCAPGNAGITTISGARVYDRVTHAQIQTWNPTADASNPTSITLGDECYTPQGICLEQYVFTDVITLANNPNGYYFAWDICCRNNLIDNLANPTLEGITYYIAIPDPALAGLNSTPDFGPYPQVGYFCVDVPNEFDMNVTDPDGDSLSYELVTPFTDNGGSQATPWTQVAWNTGAGYSLANIVGGTPPMAIDPVTGIITCSPDMLGTYVFAVKVTEWRNGVAIGETIRDVQFHALNCTQDAPPGFLGWDDSTVTVEVLNETCFDVIVQDIDVDDTIYMDINADLLANYGAYVTNGDLVSTTPDSTFEYFYSDGAGGFNSVIQDANEIYIDTANNNNILFFNEGTIALRFCYSPECEHIAEETPYDIFIESYSLGCSGSDTTTLSLELFVTPIQGGVDTIPNIFTPNDDGKNDYFFIDGRNDPCFDFMQVDIFNRWGQLVYQSDDPLFKWDGKNLQGKECTSGTYYVIISGQYGGDTVNNDAEGSAKGIGSQAARDITKYAVQLNR